jgi:antitoxin component of MazEF toxin-antitoxin module
VDASIIQVLKKWGNKVIKLPKALMDRISVHSELPYGHKIFMQITVLCIKLEFKRSLQVGKK